MYYGSSLTQIDDMYFAHGTPYTSVLLYYYINICIYQIRRPVLHTLDVLFLTAVRTIIENRKIEISVRVRNVIGESRTFGRVTL